MKPARAFDVRPPNVVRESFRVLGCAIMIAGMSSGAVAARRVAAGDLGAQLLPHQKLFQHLPGLDQRMVRELHEGLLEIENTRSGLGEWPRVGAMAAAGVPPFSANPTDARRFHWRSSGDARAVNYLGLSDGPFKKAFLILVVDSGEPKLGQPGAPRLDETHHALGDGTSIHVSIWERDDTPQLPDMVIVNPEQSGWIQILGRAPEPVGGALADLPR